MIKIKSLLTCYYISNNKVNAQSPVAEPNWCWLPLILIPKSITPP